MKGKSRNVYINNDNLEFLEGLARDNDSNVSKQLNNVLDSVRGIDLEEMIRNLAILKEVDKYGNLEERIQKLEDEKNGQKI
ncbi:MAG: hypothetical protein ABIE55_02480 [Candidatus Aenigmatarchaeota archaeon]